jgi:hypothetical protein
MTLPNPRPGPFKATLNEARRCWFLKRGELRCETISLSSADGEVMFQEMYHTVPVAEDW